MDKIHGPGLIALLRFRSILAKLGLHTPFGCLVPQLQPHFLVKPVDPIGVHLPALPTQQNVDAPITVANTRLSDLFDALLQIGQIIAMRAIVVAGSLG